MTRPSHATVAAYVALFLAVAGIPTAWALGRNTVGSPQIKANAVGSSELKTESVGSPEVKDASLEGEDFAAGQLAPLQFAEFYASMPPDNPATVAAGSPVNFPQDGPASGDIVRSGPAAFILPDVGTYRIAFSVPVTEAGQLELTLNAIALPETVYGRATGTSPIAGESLVTTDAPNSVISVVNPAGNTPALTVTPVAGGTHPVTASIIIEQVGE